MFIAVIGPDWATVSDSEGKRRLDNPDDFVRLEIATALERDIRVIPVLVENARMPQPSDLPENLKPLVRRNAIEISHTRFDPDAERLIWAIERALEQLAWERKAAESEQFAAEDAKKEQNAVEQARLGQEMGEAATSTTAAVNGTLQTTGEDRPDGQTQGVSPVWWKRLHRWVWMGGGALAIVLLIIIGFVISKQAGW